MKYNIIFQKVKQDDSAFPLFFIHVHLVFFQKAWYNKVVIPHTLHQQ